MVGRLSGIGTRRGDRRHRADRLRAHLPGAGQRDPGRARRRCWSSPPRRWSTSRVRGLAAPSSGRRWSWLGGRRRRGRTRRLRRRDDVPLRRGRSTDPERPTGRVLVLDGAPALLRRPRRPDPPGVRLRPGRSRRPSTPPTRPGEPLRAYHLGGGGLTLPRYLDADPARHARAWSRRSTPAWSRSTASGSGCETGGGIEVRVEDGRLGLRRLRRRQPGPRRRRRLRRGQRAVAPDHRGGASRGRPGAGRRRGLRRQPDRPRAAGLRPGRGGDAATELFDHVALSPPAGHPRPDRAAATWSSSPPTAPSTSTAIAARLAERGTGWRRHHRARSSTPGSATPRCSPTTTRRSTSCSRRTCRADQPFGWLGPLAGPARTRSRSRTNERRATTSPL